MRGYLIDAKGRGIAEITVRVDKNIARPPIEIRIPVIESVAFFHPMYHEEPPKFDTRRFVLERFTTFSAVYREAQ